MNLDSPTFRRPTERNTSSALDVTIRRDGDSLNRQAIQILSRKSRRLLSTDGRY
jgi:hypothetical protein